MPVHLTFYDGADCIGGNKILLEDGESSLFLDFGTNFKAEGMFFDEFLAPRSTFGFYDLLCLGILPPLKGIYRFDLEHPGIWDRYSSHPLYRETKVQGILLSHSHFDHCGHFSYIREDVPIITSLTSALICKALQDTGGGNRLQEICYTTPRELKDGLLKTGHYRTTPFRQRPFRITGVDTIPASTRGFWESVDHSRGIQCCALEPCGREVKIEGLTIRFWPVDHSIPGAGAFGIKTSAGWIVYTGDIRLHGKNANLTRQFFEEAAKLKPLALICEGTHPGTKKPMTEGEVAANCFDVVAKAEGLVVADFGPRNVERLLSFLGIAGETGRRLVLTAKDVYLLEVLAAAGENGVPDPRQDERIMLYLQLKTQRKKWEDVLIDRFDPSKIVSAEEVKKAPRNYILCFSYYNFHAFLDIQPEGGTYIYSSSEAYDEEMLIDHQRIKNWIDYFGFELYGTLGRDREKSGFHASGHIHGPGIEEMVEIIKPEVLIPVHTQEREFFKRFEGGCKVLWPERGKRIEISKEAP
ncbi:MAG: ribonuclease [Thermosediminibacterales bacterium]|nr:ribonuclease [Thermosediminibacterales bacterium]MDK2836230.1 ribonuclease [Thermosediminibacterales bacterium]